MNPPLATTLWSPVVGSTWMMAPVPNAVRSLTYSWPLGASQMYVGKENSPPVETTNWAPVWGCTPRMPIGNDDWSSVGKEDLPVATRIVPSAGAGATTLT